MADYPEHFNTDYLTNFLDMRNDEGSTSVHLSAYKGNLNILDLLIKNNASIFVYDKTGLTPMHTAASGDNPQVLVYLKEKGLHFDIKDNLNRSPLHWAAYQGSETSAMFLISWGADI